MRDLAGRYLTHKEAELLLRSKIEMLQKWVLKKYLNNEEILYKKDEVLSIRPFLKFAESLFPPTRKPTPRHPREYYEKIRRDQWKKTRDYIKKIFDEKLAWERTQ